MKRFFSLALCLLALPAQAITPFLEGRDLQPLPDSAFAQRRHLHDLEAARRPQASNQDETAAMGAANFANLGTMAWSIVHQNLTVHLDAAKSVLTLDAIVKAHVQDGGISTLEFFGDAGETWTATTLDDQPLTVTVSAFQTGYSTYAVALPAAVAANTDVSVKVHRVSTLQCNQGFQGFLQCNTSGTYHWMAGSVGLRSMPSATSGHEPYAAELHIVTSGTEIAAATGIPGPVDKLPNGQQQWNFSEPERSEHNDAFAIASYKMFTGKAENGAPIRVYTTNPYASNQKQIAQLISDVLGFYSTHLAPFPWSQLNLIQLSDDFGGGESFLMGIFAIESAFGRSPGDNGWFQTASLLSHETAHQWWGNYVSPQSLADVCLSESMAEFSSAWFTESTQQTRSQILSNNLSFAYTVGAAEDKAVHSASVYSAAKYVDIIYHKGSVVLDMLRREVGDDVMAKALSAYATQYGRDYATLSQLRVLVEKSAGRDLVWFFTQWFDRVGLIHAQLAARPIQHEDGSWSVRLRVVQPADPKLKPYRFHLPVHIEFFGADPLDVVAEVLAVADEPQFAEFPVPAPPLRVKCDWERKLLRKFVVSTPGDVNLSGLVDGADLVDMAYRQGRGIVHNFGKSGKSFFFADTSWNELYDIATAGPDGQITVEDLNALNDLYGTQAEEF